MRIFRAALLVLVVVMSVGACKKSGPVTAPPPPLRPKALPPPPPPSAAKTDCDPSGPGTTSDAVTYAVRQPRIDEAQKLANAAVASLQAGEGAELDPATREAFITEAVDGLLNALNADPYNVHATYNLAAAYARARRKECSKALLKRLAALEKYTDFQAESKRMIDSAQEDSTLKLFEKEMLEALGK